MWMLKLLHRTTVHVTSNLLFSDEFREIPSQTAVNCRAASRGTPAQCPQNVCAVSAKRLRRVRGTSAPCPRNVCAVSAERLYAVRGSSVLCPQNAGVLRTYVRMCRLPRQRFVDLANYPHIRAK